jgi:autotransporter-associated beta strand protein
MKPRKNNRILAAVLSIVGLTHTLPLAHSATLYWDGTDTSANANGGAGTWNTTATNWDTAAIGGNNATWSNANPDFAYFGGNAGTVTLAENITVGGMWFETTAYTVNTDVNTLAFSGNSPLSFNNVAAATITGAVSGTGSVVLASVRPSTASSLTFNGTSTGGWSGTTTVNASTTLALSGLHQGLLSTSGITLSGGGITLTNADNDAQVTLDRVSDTAPITSHGGTITYTNTTVASARASAETLGSVALTSGQLNIVQGLNKTAGSQVLTLSGLTQSGSAAVNFANAGGFNTTNDQIVVTGATETATNQIIGPWATTGTSAVAQTDYAIYNASGNVLSRAVAASAESTWTNSANTYTLSAAATLTATRTPGSLRYTGAAANLTLGTSTFSLQTYGVLNGGSGVLTIQNGTGGTGALTTLSGGGLLYLNVGNNGITVSAPVNDNGGAVTLVKNGSGNLTLSSTTSTFSGGIVVNGGILTTTANTNLGAAAGNVTLNGSATLVMSNSYARDLILNNGALATLGNVNPTFTGNVTGTGGLAMNTGFGAQPVFNGC